MYIVHKTVYTIMRVMRKSACARKNRANKTTVTYGVHIKDFYPRGYAQRISNKDLQLCGITSKNNKI